MDNNRLLFIMIHVTSDILKQIDAYELDISQLMHKIIKIVITGKIINCIVIINNKSPY